MMAQAAPTRLIVRAFFSGVLGALALTLFLGSASAQAAVINHPFLSSLSKFTLPTSPPQEVSLEDACGVAVASNGDVYISDYYHNFVDVSMSFSSQLQIRVPGQDPLDGPCGLALDSIGDLYVNDYHHNVVKFAPSELASGLGTVIDPGPSTGVAVDPATGDAYVNDRTYIAEYESPILPESNPVKIGVGTLGDAYGVAVSDFPSADGYLYVPDATDRTVKVYDPAVDPIHPIRVIDGAGTPQSGFSSLLDSDIAVNQSDGHFFVVDNLQPGFEHPEAVVDEFNASGAYRGQLPHAIIDGEPSGLAVDDSSGDIYATSGNGEEASVLSFGPASLADTLEIVKSGAGTVNSGPAGINCGTACAAEYNVGGSVVLTALPAPDSTFTGWTVNGKASTCPGTASCQLLLTEDTKVAANFAPAPTAEGSGAGTGGLSGVPAPPIKTDSSAEMKLPTLAVRGATATLTAVVSGPGLLSASGKGLERAVSLPTVGGLTTLHLHLSGAGQRALAGAKRRRLEVKVAVAFTPSDGRAAVLATKTVTFRAAKKGRR
jgi:hypothetical protein